MLKSSSACINAGSAAADAETDRAGNPRIKSDFIDLGAYENQSDLALITLTPAGQLTAGCVTIDTTGSVTLDIANTGLRDVTITSVDVNDANGVFAVVGANAGKVLVPGESTQVEIGFAPTAEKVFTGTIHVRSTADNAADRQLTVSGTGTAGTSVSGSVSGTWTKAKSPYTVTGDLSIARNKTLTIEPGVAVRFAGAFSFTVGYRATLKAVGTEQEPIVFTSTNTTEGWRGLRFINAGSDDVLRYCTIEYAIKPYTGANDWTNLMGGAILCGEGTSAAEGTLTPSSPTIDHCRISHCQSIEGAAICCIDESKAIITNNVLSDNTADAYGGAIFCYYYAEPTITNNVIACNSAGYGGGIYNYVSFPTIANNTIVHNRGAGLYLEATYYNYFATHNSSVVNNIVWENEIYVDSYVDADEYDIRFNDIQGGCSGTGNIDVDPLFADSAHQDYHLKSQAGRWDALTSTWAGDSVTSPCIDAGDPATAVGNEPSPHGGRINMGTYGGTAQASKSQGQI